MNSASDETGNEAVERRESKDSAEKTEIIEPPRPESAPGVKPSSEPTEETSRWAPRQPGTADPDHQSTDPTYPHGTPGLHPHGSPGPYPQSSPGPYPQGSFGAYPQGTPGPYPQGSEPTAHLSGPGTRAPSSKLTSALAAGLTWRTALIPPGIALLGGIIASVILSMLLTSMADFASLTEDTGFSIDGISYALPFILLALSLFGSAVLRFSIQATDSFDAEVSIFMVGAPLLVTIIVIGLLWWLSKRSELRTPAPNRVATWVRIAITTVAMTLVLFLLQVIFAARFSAFEDGGALTFSLSAITVRSFFLPLLVILVTSIAGRVAGHFKGTEAIGAPFLRWVVPPLLVTWIHLVVSVGLLSLIALFVLPLTLDVPGQVVPLIFITTGLILTSLVHLGGVSATAQGDLGITSNSFSETLTIFSQEAPGQLWLGLLVVAAAVLIATFVATVTRRPSWTVLEQDKQQWASAWKLPLAFCAVWGLLSLLAIPMRMSMSGSAEAAMYFGGSGAARMGVGPLAWTFLIFAAWGALIEVLSRTLGPRLVLTFPAIARLFAGRTVHPHWGPYLGMSEPRFAFIHPDVAAATVPSAPPIAPAPGQSDPSSAPGPGEAGLAPNAHSMPAAAPSGPQGHATPSGPQGYAAPTGSHAGSQAYAAPSGLSGSDPYAAPAKPFDKRKATMISVVSGGAVLLLVAALIVVTQVNGRMFGPEATVEKYFSELSDGDAEGALKVADVDVPQESRTLLTNEVLRGAKALPEDVTVGDAEVSGDTATVSVTYDIAGSKGSSELSLHRAGKKALFFDDWVLQAPELSTLAVATPGLSTVKVNGIDADTDGSALALPAFPGLYTIGLAEKSDLISADPAEVRTFLGDDVDMEGEDTPHLAAQPSDAFRAEVDNQVKTLIDSCAKKTAAEPDGCPFGSSLAESYDATDLKWSITSYPTVTVADETVGSDPYSDPESATGPNGGPAWLISSDSTGEALVTGSYEMFDETEPFDDTVTISLSGTAEIIDGKVVITVSDDPWDW